MPSTADVVSSVTIVGVLIVKGAELLYKRSSQLVWRFFSRDN
jgi:hypothetical protein